MKAHKIIVICGEVWSVIDDLENDTQVWTITENGLNELCEGSDPKHLEDKDIVRIEEIHEFANGSKLPV